jgi:hypothetical protein
MNTPWRHWLVSWLLVGAAAASAALVPPPAQCATVTGSGEPVVQQRPVQDFEAIAAQGPLALVLRQAARAAVEVRADDNLLPLIETFVETRRGQRTLVLRIVPGASVRPRSDMQVSVDAPGLRALAIAGSGPVRAEALRTPALRLSITGSADTRLQELDTDALTLSIAGSGDVRWGGGAMQVESRIAGSGTVRRL